MKVRKFGKNIVLSGGSLRQSSGKDQWNCYCDLQASLHQMCVMLWANGAFLLKRLVHSSNIGHLVVLAEKKSLWIVSVRGPKIQWLQYSVPWISFPYPLTIWMLRRFVYFNIRTLCVMVMWDEFLHFLIICVEKLFHYLREYGLLPHRKDLWNCYCDLQGTPSLEACGCGGLLKYLILKRPVR